MTQLVMSTLVLAQAVAWPVETGFAVTDRTGVVLHRIGLIEEQVPLDLEVDSTGRRFVAILKRGAQRALVLGSIDAKETRTVMEGSFFAAPRFSRDGAWVIFAHYPTGGGPPGSHQPGSYAQTYRVRADGSALPVQLTTSNGCHMESSTTDGREIYVVHSNCNGARRIERLDETGNESTFLDGSTEWSTKLGELELSPNGKQLAATLPGPNRAVRVVLITIATKAMRDLATVEPRGSTLRLRWAKSDRTLLYQQGPELWEVSPTGFKKVANL